MRGRLAPIAYCLLPIALLLAASPTGAQDTKSREREALRRSQQQVSKLQQDNAALQREKAELEAKLKAAEGELSKVKQQVGRLRKNTTALEAAEKDNIDLRAKLTAGEERLKDTTQKCQEQIATLRRELASAQTTSAEAQRQSQQDIGKLQESLQGESARAGTCEDKNRQLYSVTQDLIAKYKENRGAWEKFLLSEPFTGIKSVQVENLLEDMHERANDSRIAPAGSTAHLPRQ